MKLSLSLAILGVVFAATIPVQTSSAQSSGAPFSINISGPPQTKVGSEIELRVQLTNTSNHSITLSPLYIDGIDTSFDYEVRDSTGSLKEKKERKMQGSFRSVTLKPGESLDEGTLVSRVFNMAEPGEYSVQLSRALSGDQQKGVVKSNTITVNVVP
jgi:hypothetical protein